MWESNINANYYEIEIQDKNWNIIILDTVNKNNKNYLVNEKLKDGFIYYWHVRAHFPSNIWSPWSSKQWFAIETIESRKAKFNKALLNLSKKHSDFDKVDWYEDPSIYNLDDVQNITDSIIYIYIGKSDINNVWLGFVISYENTDFSYSWLSIKSYAFDIDGEKYYIEPKETEIKRGKYEIYNSIATETNINMIEKIIKSKKTILRSVGYEEYRDREITDKEKKCLENILSIYRLSQ
jgi:hypothetical protein